MSRILFLLIASGLLLGCETTVEVDAPDYNSELVLQGTATTHDLRLEVSRTASAFSSFSPLENIEDAEVTVTTDRGSWPVPYVDSLRVYVAPSDFETSPGTPIEVRAVADGYAPATARDTVPAAPVASIELGGLSESEDYAVPLRTIRITIDDPIGPNYYALHVIQRETGRGDSGNVVYSQRRAVSFESSAPPIVTSAPPQGLSDTGTFSGNGVYFDDSLFDGTKTQLAIQTRLWFANDIQGLNFEYHVEVSAVSAAMFAYERDVEAHSETSENPFAEPVVVEGNVNGGQGLVGGFSMSRFPVRNTGS